MASINAGPRIRLGLSAVAFAVTTVFTALIARPRMFTGFQPYDDEGYMLIALRSFADVGQLYDTVFGQYGPFYFEFWTGVFSLFGIDITHDGGRLVTWVLWVSIALILGVAAFRLTQRLWLGLAVQVLSFSALVVLVNEPMHPVGLISLLLATMVLAATWLKEDPSPWPMATIGGLAASLALIKVNVGVFAVAALVLYAAATYSAISSRRWLRLLVEVGVLALPVALMAGNLGEPWVRQFAIHVTATLFCLVLVIRSLDIRPRVNSELTWMAGGLIAVTFAVALAAVGSGSSVGDLVEGMLIRPLRQPDIFTIPVTMAERSYMIAAVAVAGALAYCYATRQRGEPSPAWNLVIGVGSLIVGLQLAFAVVGRGFPFEVAAVAGHQMILLPFCWLAIALALNSGRLELAPKLIIVSLAVLQALHAYPVAGSQTLIATFLLIVVAAICVDQGLRQIASCKMAEQERRALATFGIVAAVIVGLFVFDTSIRGPLRDARAAYNAAVPLDLPGAKNVRLPQAEVDLYTTLVGQLNANCATFISNPGMNSFYIWTEQKPPTNNNATAWTQLFEESRQQDLLARYREIPDLCLLRNEPLASGWLQGDVINTPLIRYLEDEFEPLGSIGDYQLLRGPGDRGSSW